MLQPGGNSGRKRIEEPEEQISRRRADFRSCFQLVSSRLIDLVAGGYLQEAGRWLGHLAGSLDMSHSCQNLIFSGKGRVGIHQITARCQIEKKATINLSSEMTMKSLYSKKHNQKCFVTAAISMSLLMAPQILEEWYLAYLIIRTNPE